MKKILYIVPHRLNRSAGQRFRCEHFIPFLEENNFKIKYANLLSKWDDKYFYKKGCYLFKLFIVAKTFIKRFIQTTNLKKYDAVFLYREAFMLGTTYFERRIRRKNIPIIYDFDDAIWLNDVSNANKNLKWLKKPEKTADICKLATCIIVGNSYLADFASKYNKNIHIVPTTIDTNYHHFSSKDYTKNPICIGWTGSSTTLKHFNVVVPVLKILKKKFQDKICFKVISDEPIYSKEIEIENSMWSPETEIKDLNDFDIGIMPLPDNKWTKGKCGFKGLQYMALGIPTLMSPVGVNKEIITDAENGFLPSNTDEWVEKISLLIENPELREKLGLAGRKTIEEKFSVNVWKKPYLSVFETITTK
ncbi:MAG: glycosyltransferase family 4 protein [Bacteroidales bacterium]|nr:glycosyltransferase family 4 protein [Bacteroidales bacterium]